MKKGTTAMAPEGSSWTSGTDQPRKRSRGLSLQWAEVPEEMLLIREGLPFFVRFNYAIYGLLVLVAGAFAVVAGLETSSEDVVFNTVTLVSLVLCFAVGLFATWSQNRGFLMLAVVFCLWVASSMTPVFYTAAVDISHTVHFCNVGVTDGCGEAESAAVFRAILAGIIGITTIVGAVMSWLLSEKIQELVKTGNQHQLHLRDVRVFGRTLDLPDQTVESLTHIYMADLVLMVVLMAALSVLAVEAAAQELRIFNTYLAVAIALVLVVGGYGALARDRGWLMLAFLLHIWFLASNNAYMASSAIDSVNEAASCDQAGESCESDKSGTASTVVAAIGFLLNLSGAWLAMRVSEKIEEAKTERTPEEQRQHRERSLFVRLQTRLPFLAKFDLPDRSIAQLRTYTLALCALELVIVVAFFVIGGVTNSGEARIYHFVLGAWLAVTVISSFVSMIVLNRGLIIFAVVSQTWTLTAATGYLEPAITEHNERSNACAINEDDDCDKDARVFASQIAMSVIVFCCALATAWLSYRLSERLADDDRAARK